jgi:hypothetical protein
MNSETTVVVMRIPSALKDEFRALARGNDRTMSQEVRRLMMRELANAAKPEAQPR